MGEKTRQMMDNLIMSNSNPTTNFIVHCLSIFTALIKISGLMRSKFINTPLLYHTNRK